MIHSDFVGAVCSAHIFDVPTVPMYIMHCRELVGHEPACMMWCVAYDYMSPMAGTLCLQLEFTPFAPPHHMSANTNMQTVCTQAAVTYSLDTPLSCWHAGACSHTPRPGRLQWLRCITLQKLLAMLSAFASPAVPASQVRLLSLLQSCCGYD